MPNRLAQEKSPYLQQHAHNPVDWYPWGEEAFERARAEDKPVFLSIGYSTCHWCHVMERESFEDDAVAGVLNRHYISIKVDREERPDIDHIYMQACQAMTGQGGWPLTVIMTPEKQPFFAGTYFPKQSKYGRPGLLELLEQIARLWRQDRQRLISLAAQVVQQVYEEVPDAGAHGGELSRDVLDRGYQLLNRSFDEIYGGFGGAPKFPTPHNLIFLLRYAAVFREPQARRMAEVTLQAMYRGGIYDHIGFGFARYSTDEQWLVPHFEKMLYDNALLAFAYLEAYQATRKSFYAQVARQIFQYVQREMTSPEGAFYSAQDADSEGTEGKYYVWTPDEVYEVLGQEAGRAFGQIFNITGQGNFEGRSIPHRIIPAPDPESGWQELLDAQCPFLPEARQRLLAVRQQRVPPHKDDKVLTAWNGLMIAALARGAFVLGEPVLAQMAGRAAQFIWENMRRSDGRLLASYRDGRAEVLAFLDDYAFLVWGMLELYQATWEPVYLARALELHREMYTWFADRERGGWYFTAHDSEPLPARPREIYDGAMPSGNSVAINNALRLYALTGDDDIGRQAENALQAFIGEVARYPAAHCFYLLGLQDYLQPGPEIFLAMPLNAEEEGEAFSMLQFLRTAYLPGGFVAGAATAQQYEQIAGVAPALAGRLPLQDRPAAYVCRQQACLPPIGEVGELARELGMNHTALYSGRVLTPPAP
ncbi:MAG: thioredoxin domain-containing protein [Desulfurispora sp.]|uniref:thioredoxin domain-containing protein n=1 Tax=Desulfurispora sp. TaxID=3014275 RepID=UPI00404B5D54